MTGAWSLLTDWDYPDQTEHSSFEVRGCQSPEFLMLIYGSEATRLLLCPASHSYVHYPMYVKKMLVEPLHLNKIPIPAYSVFVEHRYLPHSRCG